MDEQTVAAYQRVYEAFGTPADVVVSSLALREQFAGRIRRELYDDSLDTDVCMRLLLRLRKSKRLPRVRLVS